MSEQNQVPESLITHFEGQITSPTFLHPLFHPQANKAREMALLRQNQKPIIENLPVEKAEIVLREPSAIQPVVNIAANEALVYNPSAIMESQGTREKILADFKKLREKEMLFRIDGDKSWVDYKEGVFNFQDDSQLEAFTKKCFLNRFGSNAPFPHKYEDFLPLFDFIEGTDRNLFAKRFGLDASFPDSYEEFFRFENLVKNSNLDHSKSINELNSVTIEIYDTLERLIPRIADIVENYIKVVKTKNKITKLLPKSKAEKCYYESEATMPSRDTLKELIVILYNLYDLNQLLTNPTEKNEFRVNVEGDWGQYHKGEYNPSTGRIDRKEGQDIGVILCSFSENKYKISPFGDNNLSKFIKNLPLQLNRVRIIEQKFNALSAKYK
jgi:hypothetical protein